MKRSKIFYPLLLVVVTCLMLLILTGCIEKENPDELLDSEEVIPTEDAEQTDASLASFFIQREGMVYDYAGEGIEYASFKREIKYVQDPYIQIHEDNGGTVIAKVYRVTEDQIDLMYQQEEFYQDTNIIDKLGENKPAVEALLKAPLEVGNTWDVTGQRKRKIIGVNETVQVPAGTFSRVLVVQVTPMASENNSDKEQAVTLEYYAENVGLVMRKFTQGATTITSKLATYGIPASNAPESPSETKEEQVDEFTLVNPDLGLLAYQLDRQLRSQFQAAYESYINLKKITDYTDRNFDQIIAMYREGIQPLIVENQVEMQVKRLEDFYRAGEGEVTFPTHEVVENLSILNKKASSAQVALTVTRYFPEREWGGKAYHRKFDYIIDLIKDGGRWKIEKINSD